ncbi:MAG: pilus assembly protein PilM [Phycisphaerae bacterium]|nr:pilus assembly protein PilM [Phycisphaerae bacterium]
MATGNAVWGIDVGQCALKAIKLRPAEGGKVECVAFDVIEHPKILSQPDADRDELISSALEKFASRNDWQGDRFVVGVPGQQTFARFCKMPPIDLKKDAKKIHDLVRYEASQQIPFDIDDVVWDYQVFTSEGSPDVEVGIFAIRKDLIRKHLGYFAAVNIAPAGVQTVPAALYNFCQFDGQAAGEGGATVMIDVGAQNTDLIIVESNAAWTRNIPLGGNSFTEALVRAFKLSFAKAENLKRSAATSKYARQIFQAMRPVFADLVAEIQRSIGFYSSSHRDVELRKVLALGNAFRLPGLQKYLENNLTISGGVAKLEKFTQLLPTATITAPQFTDNILSFAAAYGLALQGLGLAKIRASLLPTELARIAVWQKKRPYFVATAAALLIAAGIPYVANALDQQTLNSEAARQARATTDKIVREAKTFRDGFNTAQTDTSQRKKDIDNLLKLQEYKTLLPQLLVLPSVALPPLNPPELMQVTAAEELKKLIASDPTRFDRRTRGQFIIESLRIEYSPALDPAQLDATAASGGGARAAAATPMTPAAAPTTPPPIGGRSARGRGVRPPTPAMPQFQAPAGGEGGEAPSAPEGAGFIVRIEGRLLYGRTQAEAIKWLTEAYFENLREKSQTPGLGFYIPDPDEKGKKYISDPIPVRYNPSVPTAYTPPGATPSAGGGTAQLLDPVTGEDTSGDWKVSFAFMAKLGTKPAAPPDGTKPTESPAGTPAPGGQPGAPRPPRGGAVAPAPREDGR